MNVFEDTMNIVQGLNTAASGTSYALTVQYPEALLPCLDTVGRQLPLRQFSAPTKVRLFEAYAACQDELSYMYEEAAKLLGKIVICNTEWVSAGTSAPAVNAMTIQTALNGRQHEAEQLAFRTGSMARAELAAEPTPTIAMKLIEAVRDQTLQLLSSLNRQLAYLNAIEQVGTIDWIADDVCRYSFFANKVTDRKINSSTRSRVEANQRRTTTRNDFDRTFEHTRVTHDVIDALRHPLPADHVEMPPRVKMLVDEIPSWLHGVSAVVTGFEISEERNSRRAVVDQWSESHTTVEELPVQRRERTHYDPALIIGPYVLTGWN
ncbi:MAG: hypothetical protein KDA96_16865 [Planctomycetaceae bacterium]|nr:hypothetical protein [Planctomycetaceae bacterium]